MIPVQNIYYMLSYAFQVLNEQGYKDVSTERFRNVAELCSAILSKGVAIQIKRGLGREYVARTETMSALKGKINMSESVKTMTMLRGRMTCSYEEFSVNSSMNQILKATMLLLLHADIAKKYKKELRKQLIFFEDVNEIDICSINWNLNYNLNYNKNNQSYRMLIAVCYLVVKGLLQTNSEGKTRLMDFVDEQRMSRLYEKFILEYYRKEHPELSAEASQIPWILDDEEKAMLPVMQSDIMLEQGDKVLIIDAKYYSHATQVRYDVHMIHSSNIYQIFTYVKNKEAQMCGHPHEVSGMLLYAKTDETLLPASEYHMSGNKISVKTLDLNSDFDKLRSQLDKIVTDHFE